MNIESEITFVCCIESGYLESQTVRMIESLRRWGGKFANAPLFAVTPRFGAPLTRETYQTFASLNVEYLRFRAKNPYSWNNYLNKPYALVAVEQKSSSESICWLDSDLLFLDEPEQLILKQGAEFMARAVSSGGTTGLGDPQEAYWQEVCQVVGIDIETLPWITNIAEEKPIRFYCNSGVFVYRRSTGLAKEFLHTCLQLLDARISNNQSGIFFMDQVALALTVAKMGLSLGALPYSHNYNMGSNYLEKCNEDELKLAKIIHYHDSMFPNFWQQLIQCLRYTHPSVADWLSSCGYLENKTPLQFRLISKTLKYFRSRQQLAYINSCKVI